MLFYQSFFISSFTYICIICCLQASIFTYYNYDFYIFFIKTPKHYTFPTKTKPTTERKLQPISSSYTT